MRIIKKSEVVFIEESLETEFEQLPEENEIKRFIKRAIKDIQDNAFCGIQIPKRLIPLEYIRKYSVQNLWKYDLPDGWRLLYSIAPENKVEILSVIIEWMNHKDYERRFHY